MINLDNTKILDILRPAKADWKDVAREMGLSEGTGLSMWSRIQAGRGVHDKTAQSIATAIESLIGRPISLADLRPAAPEGVPAK